MDAHALSAFISAAAGLLGALIGFAGSQLANKRTVDLAREQRRFERAQEMRAEVIPKLFLWLSRNEDRFTWVLDRPLRTIKDIRKVLVAIEERRITAEQAGQQFEDVVQEEVRERAQLVKQLEEVNEYFKLNRIWLPQSLIITLEELLDKYSEQGMKLIDIQGRFKAALKEKANEYIDQIGDRPADLAIKDLDERLNQVRELYEAQVRETRDWFEGERPGREKAMWDAARKVLAVDED